MKFLLLSLALVAVALCQTCDIDRSWSQYQTASQFSDGLWEQFELIGWGMDGGNKWNDFWMRADSSGVSHYSRVTCATTSQGALPAFVSMCGDCSLTSSTPSCNCYPFTDVAESYLPFPGPESTSEAPVAPEGWASAYSGGNPPFESFPSSDGVGAWTNENCKQYMPEYIYFYTHKLQIQSNGEFRKSQGISRAFRPGQTSWETFCDNVFSNENLCFVPSPNGGSAQDSERALFGARYQYQSGEWRNNDENDVQFYHNRFENGCHMKARSRRWPSASYCGDDAGWRFGAATTAHVRFGCDVNTFFDTETDIGNDVDDSDCGSVFVAFDQLSPLDPVAQSYEDRTNFGATASLVRGSTTDGACWYESSFTDHRSNLPNFRTPCSAGVLAVPFVALVSTLVMVLRNMF